MFIIFSELQRREIFFFFPSSSAQDPSFVFNLGGECISSNIGEFKNLNTLIEEFDSLKFWIGE